MSTLNSSEEVTSNSRIFYIGLGGNVGDVVTSMLQALSGLDEHQYINVLAKSRLYETPPWGDVDQDDFINACAKIQSNLEPIQLLKAMKNQEAELKREKTRRWGPRTIDLDILICENLTFKNEKLEIPHPRMLERSFVLKPLLDIAPDLQIADKAIRDWLETCDLEGIKELPDQKGWVSG
ncbi:MAG: 2-amino-4-hydroxy-6-hydroxymethyldihydropteridine diphosphokinase [Salaquimonas sp.]